MFASLVYANVTWGWTRYIFLPWFMSLPQKTLCNIVIQSEVCIAHSYTLSMSVSPRAWCLWYDDRHTVWSDVHAERYDKSHRFLWNLITEAVFTIRPAFCVADQVTFQIYSADTSRVCAHVPGWLVHRDQMKASGHVTDPFVLIRGILTSLPFFLFCDSLFLFLSLTSWPTFSVSPPESHLKTGLMRSGQGKCSCLSFPRALYIFRTPNPQHFFPLACRCPATSKEGKWWENGSFMACWQAWWLLFWAFDAPIVPPLRRRYEPLFQRHGCAEDAGHQHSVRRKASFVGSGQRQCQTHILTLFKEHFPVHTRWLLLAWQLRNSQHTPKAGQHCTSPNIVLLASRCSFSKFLIIHRCKKEFSYKFRISVTVFY